MSIEYGKSCKRQERLETVDCYIVGPRKSAIKPRRINTKIDQVQNEFVDNFTEGLRKLRGKSKNMSNKYYLPTKCNLLLKRNAF